MDEGVIHLSSPFSTRSKDQSWLESVISELGGIFSQKAMIDILSSLCIPCAVLFESILSACAGRGSLVRPGTSRDTATEESQAPPAQPNYIAGEGRGVPEQKRNKALPFI